MLLQKMQIVDLIEIIENSCVQVRTKTAIMENNQQISGTYHRHVIEPGQDYSNEDSRVKAVCAALHTPEVVAAYQAIIEANKPKIEV